MKNVALISIFLVYHAINCNVSANNYVLLSSFDKLCKEKHDGGGFITNYVVVDDITIREQFVLSWPGDLHTTPSFHNLSRNPKIALCPGLVIHPSGRFVKRSFPEGLALFWLLRAHIQFTCPTNTHLSESYYLQLEQWIESLEWNTKHWRQDTLKKDQDGDFIDSTNNIGEAPDEILLINCSGSHIGQSNHWSLSGYLRRIRISWNLKNETEITNLASITNTSLLNSSASPSIHSLSAGVSDHSSPPSLKSSSPLNNLNNQHFLSTSGIKFLVRISSHMLFVGNFSMERQKALCEFFSGFWCLQSLKTSNTTTTTTTNNHHHQDNEKSLSTSSSPPSSPSSSPLSNVYNVLSSKHAICVQATMLCDTLPDCDLRVPMNQVNLSQDETNCNIMIPSNYSLKKFSKLYKHDHWMSKLPWIILAPVPAILICALIRICSQKRQLDFMEDNHTNNNNNNNHFNDCSTIISSFTTTSNDCNKCLQMPNNSFFIEHNKSSSHSDRGTLNQFNKLSSVIEVDDEIDASADQPVNTMKMKPLNSNHNHNNNAQTKSRTDCDHLLGHCYSLPEIPMKHSDDGFTNDVLCCNDDDNVIIITNRDFHPIDTCPSREASSNDNVVVVDDDDDDSLSASKTPIAYYRSIKPCNQSKSCDSLHEMNQNNVRLTDLLHSPSSSALLSITCNHENNEYHILSNSFSDNHTNHNSQSLLNLPQTMISNVSYFSTINYDHNANNNNNDIISYHNQIHNVYDSSNRTGIYHDSSSSLSSSSSSVLNFPPNSSVFKTNRKKLLLSKCMHSVQQLLMNNSSNDHSVHNSQTKLIDD